MRNLSNFDPEVLFSLYEDAENLTPFLYRVFSQQITIKTANKNIQPKFFSFMSSNTDYLFEYCHVLIFYERVTQDQILHDFNPVNAQNKLLAEMRESEQFKSQTNVRTGSNVEEDCKYGNRELHRKAQEHA